MTDQLRGQFQFFQFFKNQTGLAVGIRDVLFSRHSEYQHIQVWETDTFGRMMTLDGLIMFTDYDEFVYHEMIAHPAMCLLGDAARVLVVGGGDGGAIREVLRYAGVQAVHLVEIDRAVIEASRQFFPAISAGFADPRLTVHVRDGIAFAREARAGSYDVVLVDPIDPLGFGLGLYETSFYQDCARILKPRGLLVTVSESPFDPAYRHVVRDVRRELRAFFPVVETYLAYIPTYQTGMWSFAIASKALHPLRDYDARRAAELIRPFEAQLKYYNPEVHTASFALPSFVKRLVEGGGG